MYVIGHGVEVYTEDFFEMKKILTGAKLLLTRMFCFHLSHRIRKPTIYMGENKGADELCSTAIQGFFVAT